MAILSSLTVWPVLVALALTPVVYRVFRAALDPLRDVPGPFLARYTRLWYLQAILNGDWEQVNIALHRKHGPVVRIAPNMYSFDDPDATYIIYGTQPTFPKSKWYSVFQPPGEDNQNIYSSANNKFAADVRKKYKPAYDAVSTYEPAIDECISLLVRKLTDLAQKGDDVDIGWWLKCFTTDVNGLIMYGNRFGHLDEGKDIGNVASALEERKNYGATVGIFPGLHRFFWLGIGVMSFVMKQIDYTLVFTQQCIDKHQEMLRREGKARDQNIMLTRFLDAHNKNPSWFTHNDVLIGALTAIVAGADTTEITLGSLFHYLSESPETLKKLRDELEAAQLSDPIDYSAAKKLPYLNAVIKETLRMHSPAGTPLWRTVPEPGMTISGRFFPAGTTVGVNVWVSQYSSTAFAPDPDTFRPARWLDADPRDLTRMNRSHIVFGVGPRNCQGEMIARMEMYKVIPQLLRSFDFDITGKWKLHNNWFVNYEGLTGKIKLRPRSH